MKLLPLNAGKVKLSEKSFALSLLIFYLTLLKEFNLVQKHTLITLLK